MGKPIKIAVRSTAMKVMKAMKVKGVAKLGKRKDVERLSKNSLMNALKIGLKQQGGRTDIACSEAGHLAKKAMNSVPILDRAGYPVARSKGSLDPKNWITEKGVPVIVDFSRHAWLPDDWGQGVKTTLPTAHSTGTGGGTYTVLVAPDGKIFYHKVAAEVYAKKKFTKEGGRGGQFRTASLQTQQALCSNDSDASFFKLLSARERKCLPSKDEFHFCIVSARRAQSNEGIRDIAIVQTAFTSAGVTPTWYVDADSLKDYKALGLNAVVGGKLTAARNMALIDAKKKGKVCVQSSDDISAWEYRAGEQAKVRTDDEANAAYEASTRYIISPVAAARFILAKMRGAEQAKKPKLGGVYMLGSCSRTFLGGPFSPAHFILGDFFVVDHGSKCLFDPAMTLKEDYDFACSHLAAYGSVVRCNRMTLRVKHYSNSGGAVATRDKKGVQERKNIAILKKKWPKVFTPNPKRANEVVMRWKKTLQEDDDMEE